MSNNFNPLPSTSKENLVETVKRILEKLRCIKLAYIFGSYAWGKPHPSSDVDVAVIIEDPSCITEAATVRKCIEVAEPCRRTG